MSHTEQMGQVSAALRRENVMRMALADGIFTDHVSDDVCLQLLREGWLERAAPVSRRPHVSRMPVYQPTEKAIEHWNAK